MIENLTMETPYYAVIFTSVKTEIDENYSETAELMVQMAKEQLGFLGVESARNEIGITVSYWKDLESIKNWKKVMEHKAAQQKGRSTWYKNYTVRIALVEREYSFSNE
ncbi:MAG: antibiotic biosynthesis monooxygenase [Flavobacterium sp.]|nr:antibiotic biosynthesis monooxygenase [Flavobacterium sp.]